MFGIGKRRQLQWRKDASGVMFTSTAAAATTAAARAVTVATATSSDVCWMKPWVQAVTSPPTIIVLPQ